MTIDAPPGVVGIRVQATGSAADGDVATAEQLLAPGEQQVATGRSPGAARLLSISFGADTGADLPDRSSSTCARRRRSATRRSISRRGSR